MKHTILSDNPVTPPWRLKPLARYITPALLAIGLSACNGGGGGSDEDDTPRNVDNTAPVAEIAAVMSPQSVGPDLELDGSGSSDPEGDALQFSWSIIDGPAGHQASIIDADKAEATLSAALPGDYVVQLVVNDGVLDSVATRLTVTLTNTAPVADAGPDRSVDIIPGSQIEVTMDGSGSFDDDGQALSYSWTLVSTPAGSAASLNMADGVSPSLTGVDLSGAYRVQLVVNDGLEDSTPDLVEISTNNVAPVANAGRDIGGRIAGDTVTLDGSGSSDFDGDSLTYEWRFTDNVPSGTSATLTGSDTSMPQFTIDQKGDYEVELTVSDGALSASDRVRVNVGNTAPLANAGADRTAAVDTEIRLSAADSTDVDGDELRFSWSVSSAPEGSNASLSGADTINPSLTPDLAGTYVIQVQVSDGEDSSTDSVRIEVDPIANQSPVAEAGPIQAIAQPNTEVILDGSQSRDPDGDTLLFNWVFVERPAGSLAELVGADTVSPSFLADIGGRYVVQLQVSDGEMQSQPDTVAINVSVPSPPVADAGPDRSDIILGDRVSLDGTASSDPDGDPLTYTWVVTSAPNGASYLLFDKDTVTPEISLSTLGDYLLQLTVSDSSQDDFDTVQLTVVDGDLDQDGLFSSYEIEQGLDPDSTDTDADGILDAAEDEDGDSLTNRWEQALGYDINTTDSDADGIEDGDEDHDGDGFSNLVEIDAGTDPTRADSFPVSRADQFQFQVRNTPVVPGGQIEYLLTAGNLSSTDTLSNVVLAMTIPDGVTFNRRGSTSLDSTGHTGCSAAGNCGAGDVVYWNLGNLAPGDNLSLAVDASVEAATPPGTKLDTPLVITADNGAEPLELQTSAQVTAEQPSHMTLTPSAEPVTPGSAFEYSVTVGNTSDNVLTNLTLNLSLASGLSATSADQSGSVNGNSVHWSLPDLLPGQTLKRKVIVEADGSLEAGTPLITNAMLSHTNATEHKVADLVTVSTPLSLALDYHLEKEVVTPGDTAVYSFTLSNKSQVNRIQNPSVLMRVPAGLSFNRSANASWNSTGHSGCSAGGNCNGGDEVVWELPDLEPGASHSLQVEALISVDARPGSLFEAPVFISAEGLGDIIQQPLTLQVAADLETDLSLSASNDPVAPGESFWYRIHYGNNSNDVLENGILSMTVPDSLIVEEASQGGTVDGNRVDWEVPSLLPTSVVERRLRVTVKDAVTPGSIIAASTSLKADGGLEQDQVVTNSTTVAATPDLKTDFHLTQAVVQPGGQLTYHLTVGNTSLGATQENVLLQMRLPQGVAYNRTQSVSRDSTGHSGCSASGNCDGGDEVFWFLGNLSAGESVSLEIDATVADTVEAGTVLDTPVFISSDSLEDVIILQESASVVSGPQPSAHLHSSVEPVAPGSVFDYRIDLGNPTNSSLEDVSLVLDLPPQLTVIDAPNAVVSGNRVTWQQPSLLPTEGIQRSVRVQVGATVRQASILKATATLSHSNAAERDQVLSHSVTVSEPLDLALDYTLDRGIAVPGGAFTYRITLGNTSAGGIVRNPLLMLRVPEGVSFNRRGDAEPDSTGHSGCSASANCDANDEVFWQLEDLGAGESITIQVQGYVDSGVTPGTVINTPVYLWADGLEESIVLQRSLHIANSERADLQVTTEADPIIPGDSFQYRVYLGNTSNEPLENLSAELELPAGVSVDSISGGGSRDGNRVSWDLNDLNPGASLDRIVAVTAANDLAPGRSLTARISLRHQGGSELDQEATITSTVAEPIPLQVDFTTVSDEVRPGGTLTYQLSLANGSAGALVENPKLILRVPEGVSFNRNTDATPASSGHSGCSASGGCDAGDEVVWELPTIAAGDTAMVEINALVADTLTPGTLIATPLVVTAAGLAENITQQSVVRVIRP
ncbi:MAG: PKD domain-containing protein [Pseudomonadota bacterium]|nr:PKD domain-containing protein [Pseudomonadota bacterium]